MRAKQLLTAVLVTLFTVPVFAAEVDTSVEEKRGFIAGGILGASLGGPIGAGFGAIVGGGIFGKLIGFSRINNELEAELQYQQSSFSTSRDQMRAEITQLGDELDYMIETQSVGWNGRELPIQFRTGSSKVEHHYEPQLKEIARVLSRNLDTKVSLSGFADRRGATDYNQKLSEQRVGEIRQYLLSHGVKPAQILSVAFGETKPLKQEQTSESNFFDRRVVMQFSFDVKSHIAVR